MPFTGTEIAEHTLTLEDQFWKHHRPPHNLRDKIREGQRFANTSIELFFVRPGFQLLGEWIEEPIAKVTFIRSRMVWNIFWQRADGKWHRYPPCRETDTLANALAVITADADSCFFG